MAFCWLIRPSAQNSNTLATFLFPKISCLPGNKDEEVKSSEDGMVPLRNLESGFLLLQPLTEIGYAEVTLVI
jgi:hypothetical protein